MRAFWSIFSALLFSLQLAACSASYHATLDRSFISLFYATDRAKSGQSDPADFYSALRGPMQYGVCTVSVPPKHRVARLETPVLKTDPDQHFALFSLDTLSQHVFFDELSREMQKAGRKKTMLVFVHGYNMSFEDAVLRMAQVAADLDFRGVPLIYSWPSQCSLRLYREDERNVAATEENLFRFLAGLAERSDKGGISLLAHSMGSRALTAAFATLARERSELLLCFRTIILAAPDIDADSFRRDIAPSLAGKGVPVTLYVSASDRALSISEDVNGSPRAGEIKDVPLIVSGIDTIDASEVDGNGFLGHSYYGRSKTVLSDIYYIINHGIPAAERFALEPVDAAEGRYWRFRK
ncbi:MAG: alpha/beta hydrolase [Chlorobi bacterium]|nr:alpha/beta hydrolase [Chlorobiota bacterium]